MIAYNKEGGHNIFEWLYLKCTYFGKIKIKVLIDATRGVKSKLAGDMGCKGPRYLIMGWAEKTLSQSLLISGT